MSYSLPPTVSSLLRTLRGGLVRQERTSKQRMARIARMNKSDEPTAFVLLLVRILSSYANFLGPMT